MKRTYKTAQGQLIDIDALRLANEDAIAVGNMHVNARGDQLGPGGGVAKPRNQLMEEYYQIQADPIETMLSHQNQGVSVEEVPVAKKPKAKKAQTKTKKADVAVTDAVVSTAAVAESTAAVDESTQTVGVQEPTDAAAEPAQKGAARPLRGNLADSIAKEAQVNQTLLKPLNKRNGIQRI
jgi:hypothetical protein